jgi:hypothetical protein
MELTVEDFDRALALFQRTEPLMPKVFSSFGRLDTAQLYDAITGIIAARKSITEIELQRMYMKDLTRDELAMMLDTFQAIGICNISISKNMTKTITYKEPEDERSEQVERADETKPDSGVSAG